jgi:hypothetical protein
MYRTIHLSVISNYLIFFLGSKDIIENDDIDEYGVDAGVVGEHSKRPRPRKHKPKKPSRYTP